MSDDEQFDISNSELSGSETLKEALISDNENGTAADIAENTDDVLEDSPVRRKRIYNRGPLIIAACIFLATLIVFGVWKCFFDTSIGGTWGMEMSINDGSEKVRFNLTFEDNKTARFHSGGVVYIGRYELADDDDHGKVLNLYIPVYGQVQLFSFNYDFDGNIFTGRRLKLTDLSGMFLSPDDSSSSKEETESKKKTADSVEIDGVTYYRWDFKPGSEGYRISKSGDFKSDEKIIGSWLYKNDEVDYSYTMTFNSDGTFEQLSPDLEIHGTYTVKDGVCYTKFYPISNSLSEQSFSYVVDGDKFSLGDSNFIKTDDKYAYKSEIN